MTAKPLESFRNDISATTETTSTQFGHPQYIDTTVSGRDETGVTILQEDGKGVFFPDSSTCTNVVPLRGAYATPVQNHLHQVSVKSLYPHWEEASDGPGEAIRLIREAEKELLQANESLCRSDVELLNFLVFADSCLFKSLKVASFNKAFEIVINFCAWAIRNGQNDTGQLPSLPGMCSALHELADKPFVGADRVTQIVMDLEELGWNGASPVSVAFEQALDSELLDFSD